jgi:hypothetical protein
MSSPNSSSACVRIGSGPRPSSIAAPTSLPGSATSPFSGRRRTPGGRPRAIPPSSRYPSASAASERSWPPRRPSSSSFAGPLPRPCPGCVDGDWSMIASSVSSSRRMGGRSEPSQRAVERQCCGLTVSIRPAPSDKATSTPPPTHGRIAMTIAPTPPCAARRRTRRCRRWQRASSLVAGFSGTFTHVKSASSEWVRVPARLPR